MKHKIGIMGGTFDPIHMGHLLLAQSAYESLQLEKVVFIPAGNPPHKRNQIIEVSARQRAEMVALAIEEDPRFELDLMEVEKDSYSYTYETLQELNRKHPENDYYFIIGGDSLRDFYSWKKPELIVQYCHLAASYRPGISTEMNELLEKNRRDYGGDFVKVPAPMLDISSHQIRELAQNGQSIRYYVPEKVWQYIAEKEFYKKI